LKTPFQKFERKQVTFYCKFAIVNQFKLTIMKYIILILTVLVTSNTFAQETLFENIRSKGENPVYVEFQSVRVLSDGKQSVGLSAQRVGQYDEPQEVIVKILNHEGIDSGIAIINKDANEESGSEIIKDYTKGSQTFTGFPNTYIAYEERGNDGYVAVGNYLFYIRNFSSRTEFRDISNVYVLKGTAPDGKTAKKKKKKKGFGRFLDKVKDKAVNGNMGPDPRKMPEYKAISQENVRELITDYLKSMRAKQVAYTLTKKDKEDLATLDEAGAAYQKYIKDKNDAYWKSPAGQKTLRGWKLADQHKANCRLTEDTCTSPFH
jgi:hypothetical protein